MMTTLVMVLILVRSGTDMVKMAFILALWSSRIISNIFLLLLELVLVMVDLS